MEPEKIYLVVVNGKPQGPYSIDELQGLKIKSGTFVRKPGMDDYKEAHAIPELRALFNLKATITVPQYFASFDLRLFASVVDHLLIAMLYVFLLLMSFIIFKEVETRILLAITFSPMIIIGKFIYACIAESSAKQATIGKRLVKIKVTNMLGERITFPNAVGRNLAKLVSTASFFFGYLYSFLNKKQQCFHDIMAETLVVKDRLL